MLPTLPLDPVPARPWRVVRSWPMSRPNLPPKQPAEYQIEFGGESSLACVRCPGISADDKQATRWQPPSAQPGHTAKAPPHPVPDHRTPDRTRNNESDFGRCHACVPGRRVVHGQQVRGQEPPICAPALADRQVEFLTPPHPGLSGKQDFAPSSGPHEIERNRGSASYAGRSGAQARPALPAARSQDRTARACPHAQPEPVRLRPTAVVGLKCTLTHCDSRCGATGLVGCWQV